MVVYQRPDADADRIFHALADGTRRDIVALAVGGGYIVSTLAKRYPMSFAAVQKHVAVLERAGRKLLEQTRMSCVLITRGSRGMALFEPGKKTVHIPIFGSDQIADVTGAGDTVMATMTLALAAGGSFEDAARLANYAGGLVAVASVRLLEKTGFKREGFARQYLCIDGAWQDHLLYARLKDDPWPQGRTAPPWDCHGLPE